MLQCLVMTDYLSIRQNPSIAKLARAIERWFPARACDDAFAEISTWVGYQATPLVPCVGLAHELGIGTLHIKEEGGRFGLGSFKALGGAYAVEKRVAGRARETVISATEGNHGRSVAWGARRAGANCVILVHPGVAAWRREAIAAYGADLREIKGNYDDTVREAARLAREIGWHLIADTSHGENDETAALVMQGYTVLMRETAEAITTPPTHVFVQAGVGGLASAVLAACQRYWQDTPPRFVLVEPENADSFIQSFRAGHPVAVTGSLATNMAGLACGEVSLPAWELLVEGVTDCLTIADKDAKAAQARLAYPEPGDIALSAGLSGAAGLAGLTAALSNPETRALLQLDENSRVLLINSEGASGSPLGDPIF